MRRPLDAYYTPPELAARLVGLLPIERGDVVLEPHAGGGAFVNALRARNRAAKDVVICAADINPDAPGVQMEGVGNMPGLDFLSNLLSPEDGIDWVIGNPPYDNAAAHVKEALRLTRKGVGFLLRLAFLESASREAFWKEHPPAYVYILSRRPTFTGDGRTDSCAYGFFVWVKHKYNEPRLRWLMGA